MYSHACGYFHLERNESSDGVLLFNIKMPNSESCDTSNSESVQTWLTKACVYEAFPVLIVSL